MTALLLARESTGTTPTCEGLTQALAGFTGEWTPLIRKRVAKHVKACPECHERGHERAVGYVSAFTLPVVLILAPRPGARRRRTVDARRRRCRRLAHLARMGSQKAVGGNGRRIGRGLAMAGSPGWR